MMPDKIYLNKYMLRRGMLYPAQYPADVPEEEYIRKDALMQWAKNEKAWLKKAHKHEWSNDDILLGGELILDNLIEKIESL